MLEIIRESTEPSILQIRRFNLLLVLLVLSTMSISSQIDDKRASQQNSSAESLVKGTEVFIKVVAVKDAVQPASEWANPEAGKKFISIQIIVNNKGKDEWRLLHSNFRLKDIEGHVYDMDLWNVSNREVTGPALKDGIIDGGDLVKGWITFQVDASRNARSLKLRYEEYLSTKDPIVTSGWIDLSAVLK